MMGTVDDLKKVIAPNFIREVEAEVDLREDDSNNSYKIKLKGTPPSLLMKMEDIQLQPRNDFLIRGQGFHSRADYALINDDKFIFIELKSGGIVRRKIEQQFYGALCAIDYCVSIGKHFLNRKDFLHSAVQRPIFVVLRTSSDQGIKKRPTNCRPNRDVDIKEFGRYQYKDIFCYKNIHYSKLIAEY